MTDAQKAPEPEEEKKEKDLAETLAEFPGAPTRDGIEEWKQKHSEVFCSGFSPLEIFVWRSVTRGEFGNLQAAAAAAEEPLDMEAALVGTCLLWATPDGNASLEGKAGTLTTLHEQILQNSNFMDPRVAEALVIKL